MQRFPNQSSLHNPNLKMKRQTPNARVYKCQYKAIFIFQNKDGFQPIISQITNSLSSGTTRSKGLLILKSLFKTKVITDDVLISHGQTWLPLCVKTLKPLAVSPHEKSLALLVISMLDNFQYLLLFLINLYLF